MRGWGWSLAAFDEEAWLSIVDAFNAAALEQGSWLEALAGLAAATGSHSGQLISFGSSASAQFNWITEVDPDWLEGLVAAGGTDPSRNPRLAAGLRAPVLRLLTDVDVISPEERRRNPIYADFLDNHDLPFICATTLIRTGQQAVGLAVLRSNGQREIEPDQRRIFASIAPHIRTAVRTQMALEGQAAQVLAGAFESLTLPVFICDGNGSVRVMTKGAEELVSTGDGLTLNQQRLNAVRAEETASLAAAIQRATHGLQRPGEPPLTTLLIHRKAGAFLVLDVIPLPRRPYSFGFEPRALVVARSGRPDPRRSRLLLQAAYRLTSAEADVALQLAGGHPPETIAANRNVSVGTVRAQIRTIYSKLNVGRQIELVARLRELACI